MSTNHLAPGTLSALLDGALAGGARERAERHLATCDSCRGALAALTRQDEALKQALAHDPGEAYFAGFAGRVEERIRAAGRAAAPARAAGARRLGSPAWLGAAAAVVVAVGITFLVTRETNVVPLRDRSAIERSAREAERPGPGVPVGQRAPAATERKQGAPAANQTGASAGGRPAAPGSARAPAARAGADLPSPASAPPGAAAPMAAPDLARMGRAQEVRRDERGEEVPVSPPSGPAALYARPPAPAQIQEAPAGPVTVKKQERAMPMGTPGAPAAEKTGGAPAAPEPARAPSAALDQSVAANAELCGDVRDPTGRPVAGASVVVAESGIAARTDVKGRFCLSAPAGERTLAVLAVGYVPVRQGVRVGAGAPRASVVLEPVAVLSGPRAPRTQGVPGFATPPPEAGDVFGALPDSLRGVARGAQLLSASAAQLRSAEAYDRAADAWSALAPSIAAGPIESEARFQAASARVHAWEAAPTPERRAAAATALDAYLAHAEPGARRDQAMAWRGRL